MAALHISILVLIFGLVAHQDGWRVSLGTIYVGRWAAMIIGLIVSPIPYNDVGTDTWLVVYGSLLAVAVGYTVAHGRRTQRSEGRPWQQTYGSDTELMLSYTYLRQRLQVIVGAGLVLLAIYIVSVSQLFTPSVFVTAPSQLRVYIQESGPPLGFHFFYLMELVPGLCVLLWYCRYSDIGRSSLKLLTLVGTLSTVTLMATGARTNVIKAILLTLVIWLALRYGRAKWGVVLRGLPVFALVIAVIAIGMVAMRGEDVIGGGGRGLRVPSDAPALQPVFTVYHLNVAPLVAFDALLEDEGVEKEWGGLTLNPLAKVAGKLVEGYEAPSHIGEFYRTPYLINITTHLDVMYKDFGVPGVMVLSLFLGCALGSLESRYAQSPSGVRILLWSVGALVAWASVSAAAFIKPVYWFQAVVLYLIGRGMDARKRRVGNAGAAVAKGRVRAGWDRRET